MSARQPLPDFALTAYAHGGVVALVTLVTAGLVDPGDYECPRCGGAGKIEVENWLHPMSCDACSGDKWVYIWTSGRVSRGRRGLEEVLA